MNCRIMVNKNRIYLKRFCSHPSSFSHKLTKCKLNRTRKGQANNLWCSPISKNESVRTSFRRWRSMQNRFKRNNFHTKRGFRKSSNRYKSVTNLSGLSLMCCTRYWSTRDQPRWVTTTATSMTLSRVAGVNTTTSTSLSSPLSKCSNRRKEPTRQVPTIWYMPKETSLSLWAYSHQWRTTNFPKTRTTCRTITRPSCLRASNKW